MKETELWARLNRHLGEGYARVWAAEHSITVLDGRTVQQALDEGERAKVIWRAVWADLELPARDR